jgi:hypothetical protein
MRRVLPLKIALASLLFAACVTINVYFPAAAADKAADQFINDVTGGAKTSSGGSTPPPQSNTRSRAPVRRARCARGLPWHRCSTRWCLPPMRKTPRPPQRELARVSRIKQSMAARFPEMEKFFASGAVGLTKDGLVEVRDINAVALPDRATVKRLVAEDNNDRAQLYTEIARASNHPEWESDIQEELRESMGGHRGQAGLVLPDSSGSWKQK